jgi:hypothetical protein
MLLCPRHTTLDILPLAQRMLTRTCDKVACRHVDILVLDSLRRDMDTSTHIGMHTALEIARHVKPTRTLLVGMSHTVCVCLPQVP